MNDRFGMPYKPCTRKIFVIRLLGGAYVAKGRGTSRDIRKAKKFQSDNVARGYLSAFGVRGFIVVAKAVGVEMLE